MNRCLGGLLALVSLGALADTPAGSIDVGFGVDGFVTTAFDRGGSRADDARAFAQDKTGRLVLAGLVDIGGSYCLGLARYSADGQRDPQFHQKNAKGTVCHDDPLGGIVSGSYQLMSDLSIAIAQSNYIYVAGSFFEGNTPDPKAYVCRFLPNGGFDRCAIPTSATNPGSAATEPSVRVHGNELLLIVNPNTSIGEAPELHRMSLEDLASAPPLPLVDGLIASAIAWSADVTDDGELLVAGEARFPGSLGTDFFVARFDLVSNELVDSFGFHGIRRIAYDKGGSNSDRALAVRALEGGDILVAGAVQLPTPANTAVGIARLDSSGEDVPSFNNGERLTLYDNFDATIDVAGVDQTPSGRVIVAGNMNFSGAVVGSFALRLMESGVPDLGFDEDGLVFLDISGENEPTCSMALQGERVVLGGSYDAGQEDYDFLLFRLSDGRLFNDSFD